MIYSSIAVVMMVASLVAAEGVMDFGDTVFDDLPPSKNMRLVSASRIPRPNLMPSLVGFTAAILFSAAAIYNFANASKIPAFALVTSIGWLALLSLLLFNAYLDCGTIRELVKTSIGPLVRYHYVEVWRQPESNRSAIAFGYWIFWRRCNLITIDPRRIISVTWSAGQASGVAHKDMNDWSVKIRYKSLLFCKSATRRARFGATGFYQVGPYRSREETEEFGIRLCDFLESAGFRFPGRDELTQPNASSSRIASGRQVHH